MASVLCRRFQKPSLNIRPTNEGAFPLSSSDSEELGTDLVPEKNLTLVAFRLAVLEKLATALGRLGFVWATVILLGGYVSSLRTRDFAVISTLLVTEGGRVFCRTQELVWQNLATRSIFDVKSCLNHKRESKRRNNSEPNVTNRAYESDGAISTNSKLEEYAKQIQSSCIRGAVLMNRRWSIDTLPLIPYGNSLWAQRISALLYVLQLISATITIGFSVSSLCRQNYGPTQNLDNALNIYYILMLSEASVFLIQRAYWEVKISWKKLLMKVNEKCKLGPDNANVVREFFYDVYSSCLNGSVFDGLEKDLVSFSIAKITSSTVKDQRDGVSNIAIFLKDVAFKAYTVRKIGTTPGIIDRLLQMLAWKKEVDIRKATITILREIARSDNNSFRIAAVAGGLESIVSLVQDENDGELKFLGLQTLECLAKNHRQCVRIGETRGLILSLIDCIELKASSEFKFKEIIVESSLQILKMLAATQGGSGQCIRKDIAKAVMALRNLREILQFRAENPLLQELAVKIIKNLALEDEIKEAIGNTGGIIHSLTRIFLSKKCRRVSLKAGEALNLLVLDCPKNCIRMMGCSFSHNTLVSVMEQINQEPEFSACATNILRQLCRNLRQNEQNKIAEMTPNLMRVILESKNEEQQEACLGLAACTIPLLTKESYETMFKEIEKYHIVDGMNMVSASFPSLTHLPQIRRYSLEFIIELMKRDKFFVRAFKEAGMEKRLEMMLETMSEVENFCSFSGAMGVHRHSRSLEELIEDALHYICPS